MSLTSKYSLIAFCLIMSGFFLIAGPAALAGTGVEKANNGLDATAKGGYGVTDTKTLYPDGGLPQIIGKVIGAALAFVGVVFFCLILWAGFGWMLAKGNEEEVRKAKETIITAVLGLIVILGAYAITTLIARVFSNALTGAGA